MSTVGEVSTSGGASKFNSEENHLTSSAKSQHKKKSRRIIEDYDSTLTAFNEYSSPRGGVGYEFEVGDMVWGKVKSHPWWPGHIYDEAFASPSVRRSKHDGHVLVAFFGDSSYGWFEPEELIPFEENFSDKSRQIFSKAFAKAIEEALDELSRRRSLGLACRCRNEFNFWPCSVGGYFVVDVGDSEPWFYSSSQICKAKDSFKTKEMLKFLKKMAWVPLNDQHLNVEFMKNKATALAYRKASFEEFDETYAQAFGNVPQRPPRPTAPVAIDPSKGPLSGPLVIAEALGKAKNSVKSNTKDQLEKDKYLFKRRDEPIHVKSKKAVGPSTHKPLVDGHQISESGVTDGVHPPTNQRASMVSDIKPSESSKRHVEGGPKKAKVHKQPAGELSSENAGLVEKKKKKKRKMKKEISNENSGNLMKSPDAVRQSVAIENVQELSYENASLVEKKKKKKIKKEISNENSGNLVLSPYAVRNSVAVENVPDTPPHVPYEDKNRLDIVKVNVKSSPLSPIEAQQAADTKNLELLVLVRDLRDLALNPFHGEERRCAAIVRQVFWKYRSLVYKKSLSLMPPSENEASQAQFSGLPATGAAAFASPADKSIDKSTVKLVKPSVRSDDPTIGGKKRCPSDHLEGIKKKKKLVNPEDIKKKKLIEPEDVKKKKKVEDLKILSGEKKIPQHGDVKELAAKNVNVSAALPKAVKLETSKKMEKPVRVPNPTMLVMRFPTNSALPSGAELRAKFARFGPLDHSATRIFWKSYQCRLVYHYKVDAEAALKFAIGSNILFGNSNVRCYIRDLEVEAAESEPVRVPKEDAPVGALQSRETPIEQRNTPRISSQTLQQSGQLKSCLKKPSGDESGNGGAKGGSRVKFVLDGKESSSRNELSGYKNNIATSLHEGTTSSSAISKNLPKNIPQSNISSQFGKLPINVRPPPEQMPRAVSFNAQQIQQMPIAPTNDISRQMINLLVKCNEVVNNVSKALGYMPYHPL
ncbi:hypothetical protein ACJIZ3_001354 [Penstemon smallii]|uniref:PWWP domain-containing protein n=1 Tax=Penstemon smallii TaxID=265156 RepID=A0ABD3U3D6_9LAMI